MRVKDLLENNVEFYPSEEHPEEDVPVVSVLLPTFSRYKSGLLERAVSSVLSQSFRALELIIVVDGSTDGTLDYVKSVMKTDGRVSCIYHKKNIGLPAVSEYEAYMKSRGQYIAFIFDDNEWYPDALERTLRFMHEHNIQACFGITYFYVDHTRLQIGGDTANISDLLLTNICGNGSVVLHREVIENVGLYDPHLALTRLCDWDLWRRIIRQYAFVPSEIPFTTEHGVNLSNSLGNSYDMNRRIAEERMQQERNARLLPAAFENVDIAEHYHTSPAYFDYVSRQSLIHQNKFWWEKIQYTLHNNSNSCIPAKYVAVICNEINASITLTFLKQLQEKGIIIRFYLLNTFETPDLVRLDALIIARTLFPENHPLLAAAKQLHIPVYHYVDDCFPVLSVDYSENEEICQRAELTNQETLSAYEGVICSTEALADYYRINHLHGNCFVLGPSPVFPLKEQLSVSTGPVTIGFMGGAFRASVLEEIVLPALIRLSEQIAIRLVLPDYYNDDSFFEDISTTTVEIIQIPFHISYEETIASYLQHHIQILIHPGNPLGNNKYKTLGAIFNAVQLGAVPVCSDILPYSAYAGKEIMCLCRNDIEVWYRNLLELLRNPQRMQVLFENALAFCKDMYSVENSSREFVAEISKMRDVSPYEQLSRFETIQSQLIQSTSSLQGHGVIHPEKIAFVPMYQRRRTYYIESYRDNLSGIGLIFANTDPAAHGSICVRIIHAGNTWHEEILSSDDIKNNAWTTIAFPPIASCEGEVICIAITIDSSLRSALGIFERKSNSTYAERIAARFGISVKKRNVLYYTLFS